MGWFNLVGTRMNDECQSYLSRLKLEQGERGVLTGKNDRL